MSYQELTVDDFLERVLYMPDTEAEQELIFRKERGAAEVAMLSAEAHRLSEQGYAKKTARANEIGKALQVVGADNQRINEALKALRRRMDAATWSKAVTAIFGQEGYERCKVWMLMNNPERAANYGGDLKAFMLKHGMEVA